MNAKEIDKKIDYRILAFFQVVASSPNSTVSKYNVYNSAAKIQQSSHLQLKPLNFFCFFDKAKYNSTQVNKLRISV